MAVSGGVNPLYTPGMRVSMAVSAAVTAGTLVEVSGDNTVGPASAGSKKVVGVALQTASVAGDVIAVLLNGYVFKIKAEGAVTAGDLVTAATGAGNEGHVSTLLIDTTATVNETTVEAAINAGLGAVGVALEAIADEATGKVLVRV